MSDVNTQDKYGWTKLQHTFHLSHSAPLSFNHLPHHLQVDSLGGDLELDLALSPQQLSLDPRAFKNPSADPLLTHLHLVNGCKL